MKSKSLLSLSVQKITFRKSKSWSTRAPIRHTAFYDELYLLNMKYPFLEGEKWREIQKTTKCAKFKVNSSSSHFTDEVDCKTASNLR